MGTYVPAQKNDGVCLEWGRRGARSAAARGDILVVVDILSFSSAVVTAIQQGATVYPCLNEEDAIELAGRVGAELAVNRRNVPEKGRFSLSPVTLLQAEHGTRIALPSPNGGNCCRIGRTAPALLVGALVNASAAAAAASGLMHQHGAGLTVLACGERWQTPSEEGDLRFALEDYLGAGAILAALDAALSAEARVCKAAFLAAEPDIARLIRDSVSGTELLERGWPQDVEHAARLDLYDAVPVLNEDCLERLYV